MTGLQNIRIQRGLTQVELANEADINLRSLQYYEQGRKDIEHIRLDKLLRLCLVLDCKLSEIVEDSHCRILAKQYEKGTAV